MIKYAAVYLGMTLLAVLEPPANAQDSWETKNSSQPTTAHCSSVDSSLFASVFAGHRAGAIAKLEKVPAVALSKEQTAFFLGLEVGDTNVSASSRIRTAIEKLKEQKRLELEEHIGSWALSFQERLDKLEVFIGTPSAKRLEPYLVRAIAKNDFGTGFFVTDCGDRLAVLHGSLGSGPAPPSIRFPLIVFLDHAPKSVWAGWAMAQ